MSSPYRVLRSYVFDDNADVLSQSSRSSSSPRRNSTNSDSSEFFSTRHLLSTGRPGMQPTLFIPGHGHILAPAARPQPQQWNNPRDYWTRRQKVSNSPVQGGRNPSLAIISEEAGYSATSPASPVRQENLLVDIHPDQN